MIIKSIEDLIAGRTLVSVAPETSVTEACGILDSRNIGALAVVEGDRLIGIFSERDVIGKAVGKGADLGHLKVRDIMTPDPTVIAKTQSLFEAWQIMTEGGFRHLPVLEGGCPIGMISLRDIPVAYRLMAERYDSYLGSGAAA